MKDHAAKGKRILLLGGYGREMAEFGGVFPNKECSNWSNYFKGERIR